MKIQFRTSKLQKQFETSAAAIRAYGPDVARKYIQRVQIIQKARSFDEIRAMKSLYCHPLKGERDGQWAIKLTARYRLIFTLRGLEFEIVRLEEVSDHYGD